MTFPSNLPPDFIPPFTESLLPANLKPRMVFCPECHYEIETELPGPICGMCHSKLITVLEPRVK